jgi:hypothetical protein
MHGIIRNTTQTLPSLNWRLLPGRTEEDCGPSHCLCLLGNTAPLREREKAREDRPIPHTIELTALSVCEGIEPPWFKIISMQLLIWVSIFDP